MTGEKDATAGSSPALDDEVKVTTEGNESPSPAAEQDDQSPTPTASPAEDAPKPEPKAEKPPAKEKDAPAPDPVKAALDKLSRSSDPKSPKAGEKAPEQPAPKAPKPKAEQQPAMSKDDRTLRDNPFAGLSSEETAALKTKTQNRIQELHRRWREAEDRAASPAESDPLAGEFSKIVKEHKLDDDLQFVPPEHLSGIVKVQASINRAAFAVQQGRLPAPSDMEMISATAKQIRDLATHFGADLGDAAPQITPFAGELPADLKDLVEVYGVPEDRVRLLAAIEATKGKPAQQPAAQPPAQAAPQAPPRETGVDMDALYAQRAMRDLVDQGVRAEHVQAHMAALEPFQKAEVQRRFPAVQAAQVPRVYNALPPAERYEITMAAHREMVRQSQARPSTTQPLAPPRAPTQQGGVPRKLASAEDSDPVQAALARLSRSE